MKLDVVTDASWRKLGYHSEGEHLIVAHERELGKTGTARTNVLSAEVKLQRVVNFTGRRVCLKG